MTDQTHHPATVSRVPTVTVLNTLASCDFAAAVDTHVAWNLRFMDLKDHLFEHEITALTDAEAEQANAMIEHHGLRVHCFSTTLFHKKFDSDVAVFTSDLIALNRTLEIARVLRPQVIRLLPACTAQNPGSEPPDPALIDIYRAAVDRITNAGFIAMIENEVGANVLSTPDGAVAFFGALARPATRLIWDIGNMWQTGTFPTVAVYEQLRPLIGAIHLKGGQSETPGGPLTWAARLQDTSWPVMELLKQALRDRPDLHVCLNSPHGRLRPDYDYEKLTEQDLAFIHQCIQETM